MKGLATLVSIFLVFSFSACAQEPRATQLLVVKSIDLPNVHNRIDHMDIDLAGKRLFIGALENDSLEVVDFAQGRVSKTISKLGGPQGIAYVPENNTIWVAARNTGNLIVLDGATYAEIKRIPFGDEADNLHYLPKSQQIILGYGSGGIAILNALTMTLTGSVPTNGHPEGLQGEEGSGLVFANIPTAQTLQVLDFHSIKPVASWSPAGIVSNFPLAIESPLRFGAYYTHVPSLITIFDARKGTTLSQRASPGDVDDLFVNNTRHWLYLISGSGRVEVWSVAADGSTQTLAWAKTGAGARTGFYSPELDLLFVAVPESLGTSAKLLELKGSVLSVP